MKDPIVIKLDNVTLRVRDTLILPNTNWQIDKGQHWAIMGPNGAGKTSLVKALTGEEPVVRGTIYSKTNLIYVTHYPPEIPTCMTHMLQFENTQTGRYRPRSRRL